MSSLLRAPLRIDITAVLTLAIAGCIQQGPGHEGLNEPPPSAPYLLIDASAALWVPEMKVEDAELPLDRTIRDRTTQIRRDADPPRDRLPVDQADLITCLTYCDLLRECALAICNEGEAAIDSGPRCTARCEEIPARQREQSYALTSGDPLRYCEDFLLSVVPLFEVNRCF